MTKRRRRPDPQLWRCHAAYSLVAVGSLLRCCKDRTPVSRPRRWSDEFQLVMLCYEKQNSGSAGNSQIEPVYWRRRHYKYDFEFRVGSVRSRSAYTARRASGPPFH